MPAPAAPPEIVRERIFDGLTAAVARKGYGATTVDDIVSEARISKSTFYAQFQDKADAFVAAYESFSGQLLDAIAVAVEAADDADEARVRAAVGTYLEHLAQDPGRTRAFHTEVMAAGAEAIAARRRVLGRFAALISHLTAQYSDGVSEATACFLVGGINELVLEAAAEDRAAQLPAHTDEIVALALAAGVALSRPA